VGLQRILRQERATTELAARLLLLVYSLWVLFVRFIVPHKHTEAKRGPTGAIGPPKGSANLHPRRLGRAITRRVFAPP
jgi:hypothetical protein